MSSGFGMTLACFSQILTEGVMGKNETVLLPMEKIHELILETIPIGILFATPDTVLRYMNKTYAQYLGIDPKEYIGRPINECVPETRLYIVMESGKVEMGDLGPITTKLGKINIIVNRLPVFDSNGNVIGGISQSLFSDPSELHTVA